MIPQKDNALQAKEEKHGSFAIFDIEHFLRRVIRNWYWFLILGVLGYSAAWFYNKYYTQNIFSSNLSLSISNNTASYFTPSQSINFIWGQSGNQDGVYQFRQHDIEYHEIKRIGQRHRKPCPPVGGTAGIIAFVF